MTCNTQKQLISVPKNTTSYIVYYYYSASAQCIHIYKATIKRFGFSGPILTQASYIYYLVYFTSTQL